MFSQKTEKVLFEFKGNDLKIHTAYSKFETKRGPVFLIGAIYGVICNEKLLVNESSGGLDDTLLKLVDNYDEIADFALCCIGKFIFVRNIPEKKFVYASPETGGLFYRFENSCWSFSYDQVALAKHSDKIDSPALLYVLGNRKNLPPFKSLFENIRRVPGGFTINIRENNSHELEFLFLKYNPDTMPKTKYYDFINEWESVLTVYSEENTKRKTYLALSGGVDSVFICAIMKKLKLPFVPFHYYLGNEKQMRVVRRIVQWLDLRLHVSESLPGNFRDVSAFYREIVGGNTFGGRENWNGLLHSVKELHIDDSCNIIFGENLDCYYNIFCQMNSLNSFWRNKKYHSEAQRQFTLPGLAEVPLNSRVNYMISFLMTRVPYKGIEAFCLYNAKDSVMSESLIDKLSDFLKKELDIIVGLIKKQCSVKRDELIENNIWYNYLFRCFSYVVQSQCKVARLHRFSRIFPGNIIQPTDSAPLIKAYINMQLDERDAEVAKRWEYRYLSEQKIPYRRIVFFATFHYELTHFFRETKRRTIRFIKTFLKKVIIMFLIHRNKPENIGRESFAKSAEGRRKISKIPNKQIIEAFKPSKANFLSRIDDIEVARYFDEMFKDVENESVEKYGRFEIQNLVNVCKTLLSTMD